MPMNHVGLMQLINPRFSFGYEYIIEKKLVPSYIL